MSSRSRFRGPSWLSRQHSHVLDAAALGAVDDELVGALREQADARQHAPTYEERPQVDVAGLKTAYRREIVRLHVVLGMVSAAAVAPAGLESHRLQRRGEVRNPDDVEVDPLRDGSPPPSDSLEGLVWRKPLPLGRSMMLPASDRG